MESHGVLYCGAVWCVVVGWGGVVLVLDRWHHLRGGQHEGDLVAHGRRPGNQNQKPKKTGPPEKPDQDKYMHSLDRKIRAPYTGSAQPSKKLKLRKSKTGLNSMCPPPKKKNLYLY